MRMTFGQSELARSVAFEVELDEDGAIFADNPAVVAGLDYQYLRGCELESAAVRILNVDAAAREKTGVAVHAQVSADDRLDVRGPAEARRVDDALRTAFADAYDIDLNTADFAPLSVRDCSQ